MRTTVSGCSWALRGLAEIKCYRYQKFIIEVANALRNKYSEKAFDVL